MSAATTRPPAPASTKLVYDFSEGSREMRTLLGGKGANVAEMTRILGADLVPAGFTITTEACVAYMRAGRVPPPGLEAQVDEALARLEAHAGRRLGDPADPLLVSVRSGARDSMPGMLDTVLNLGLNDESVEGIARVTSNERFAWDSFRRFVQMFGNVVRGIPGERFEDAIAEIKRERGATLDTDLDVDALRELVARFRSFYDFPTDPREQLEQSILAVFDSWMGARAVEYRRLNRIPEDWGTAVNVQQMVFGNKGETSGSGVAFSRNEVTGFSDPSGDFLQNAQGEDVVSGVRTPRDLAELEGWMPGRAPAAAGDPAHARAPLRRHAGHGVHDRGRPPVHAADAQRQAPGAGGRALRRRRRQRGPPVQGAGDRDDPRRPARRPAAPDVRPGDGVRGHRTRRRRLAGRGQGQHRLHGRGRRRRGERGPAGHPRPAVHRGRGRRRLRRGRRHPHVRGRQGLPRGARGARHGPTGRHRRGRPGHRPAPARGPRRRTDAARRRPHRDRRLDRGGHDRRRPADPARGGRPLRPDPRVGRRAAHARRADERRHARGRPARARASAPRGSASAAPSTCSWPPIGSRRCGG